MKQKTNSIFAKIKKTLQKKHNPNLKSYRCPNCKHIITVENKLTKKMFFHCPLCGQKNIFKTLPERKHAEQHRLKNWFSQISFNAMIIGLILTLTSLLFLFTQNSYSTKQSLTLIIIAVIIPLFIIERERKISTIITLGTVIYILILFPMTGIDLEIFLILIFLGVLVIKAVIDEYIPKPIKIRMNLFISVFFIIFVIIVTKRIINLVGM